MKSIKELYKDWTSGDEENPFKEDITWRGDMVEGFVIYCLENN